jgi:hypothetical protein
MLKNLTSLLRILIFKAIVMASSEGNFKPKYEGKDRLQFVDFSERIISDQVSPNKLQIYFGESRHGVYSVLISIDNHVIPKKLMVF